MKAAQIEPIIYEAPDMIDWDVWLRNRLEEFKPLRRERLPVVWRRVHEIDRDLRDARSMGHISGTNYDLALTLIDSILIGYLNLRRGLRCSLVGEDLADCDTMCDMFDLCSRLDVWKQMYPSLSNKEANIRMCIYLAIHVPKFDKRTAQKLGIYEPEAFRGVE